MQKIRVGTRGSKMALIQTNMFCDRLREAYPAMYQGDAIELVEIKTTGDKVQDRALNKIGGKGLFIRDFEVAMLEDKIDLAVHSMKDVPSNMPEGFEIACVMPRNDPRDCFISPHAKTLDDLPEGAVVGTSGPRRQAITLNRRPDLEVVTFRGNADTRIEKIERGEVDATYLAYSGLERIDRLDAVTSVMEIEDMLPACGQGVVGVEIMSKNKDLKKLLQEVSCQDTFARVMAERACLRELDGDCHSPLAAYAEIINGGESLYLRALAASEDGKEIYREEATGPISDYIALGTQVGQTIAEQLPEGFLEDK